MKMKNLKILLSTILIGAAFIGCSYSLELSNCQTFKGHNTILNQLKKMI